MIEDKIVTIRTPQYKDGEIFEYVIQKGSLDTNTYLFTPSEKIGHSVVGMHEVQFKNEREYLLYKYND